MYFFLLRKNIFKTKSEINNFNMQRTSENILKVHTN